MSNTAALVITPVVHNHEAAAVFIIIYLGLLAVGALIIICYALYQTLGRELFTMLVLGLIAVAVYSAAVLPW